MSLVKEFHRCPPEQLHPVNEDLMRQVGNFKMSKIVCIIKYNDVFVLQLSAILF